MRWLMCLFLATAAMAGEPSIRMATEGRIDLAGVAMKSIKVSAGKVTRNGEVWVVTFPVDWWRWRDVEVSFVPLADHKVNLSLSGPWAVEDGSELRQELLWEEAAGSTFTAGVLPEGWSSPWRAYPEAGQWPINGDGVAASWHGRPLMREIGCQKGVEMKWKLRVRAAVPEGFVRPARLSGVTPAHRMVMRMKRGVNLGNCWEGVPGKGAVSFDADDIDRIVAAGFDHIRVPVGWHFRMEGGRISEAFLDELEPVIRQALDRKMVVMLDWHGFHGLTEDPGSKRREFVEGWRRIAAHFSKCSPELIFELLNEPCDKLSGELLNEIHGEAIEAIRESNPNRIVVVNPGGWASADALGGLRLPDEDERIIASIHCYDPFRFTHQGAEWVGLEGVKDVSFPGALALEYERRFDDAVAWSKHFGRPVHLGEFGAFRTADPESRGRYAKAVRSAAESRGIPWCWWEWKAGFGCWDAGEGKGLLIDELVK